MSADHVTDKYTVYLIFQFSSCLSGLCNWVQEDSGSLNWTLSSGRLVDQSWDGPDYDHTQGNNEGIKNV